MNKLNVYRFLDTAMLLLGFFLKQKNKAYKVAEHINPGSDPPGAQCSGGRQNRPNFGSFNLNI